MSEEHIAVIDIGKTNKKVLIYDRSLKVLATEKKNFEEFKKDGMVFEPLEEITAWLKSTLKTVSAKFNIKALSVTTHGATAFCIDKEGNLSVPPLAYTTEASDEFRTEFYDKFGSPEELQEKTATAEVGSLINVGKLIYFAKKKFPEQFANTWKILNYPQYIGYLFTGKIGAEPTYMGCHSYLLDANTKGISEVAEKMGIKEMLPGSIETSWSVLGTVSEKASEESGLPTDCIVTMGIHDSNSSLLPYLVKQQEDFALDSTGTWCVAMHPTKTSTFEKEELGKSVFYNQDAFFNPVKTAIFMGGLEFETYQKILEKIHGEFERPKFNLEAFNKVLEDGNKFILPSIMKGAGVYPHSKPKAIENKTEFAFEKIESGQCIPEFFNDLEGALAALTISLALQTKYALECTGFNGKGKIYVEGGFRNNTPYTRLLTALFPNATVSCTHMEEATAFGAAILAEAALQGKNPDVTNNMFEIEEIPVEKTSFKCLDEYGKKFENYLK
jgi:sugar (pentulose or hexulose) kinase